MLLQPSISTTASEYAASFPSTELVQAAAGLFCRETVPQRLILVGPGGLVRRDGSLHPSAAKAVELYGAARLGIKTDQVVVEGPRWRLEIAPGAVSVRNKDYARAYRADQRQAEDREKAVAEMVRRIQEGLDDDDEETRGRVVRTWSPRSRARMVIRLAELDYTELLAAERVPVMVTLTYPGDWLAVAPSAKVARGHLDALRKRFERRWGYPIAGVWKREFQRRGAPHFHLLMVPPEDPGFAEWLSRAWADVVDAKRCDQTPTACFEQGGCEYHRHVQAGTGLDYKEGARVLDPVRLARYFAKHGAYEAKEYQNEAPAQWLHEAECPAWDGETAHECDGCAWDGVGRFWGYWRISRAVSAVEIAPDVALALVRAMRRSSHAKRYYVRRRVWRKVTTVDKETGEIAWRWRRRSTLVPVKRMKHTSGTLLVNDGPGYASQLATVARLATSTRRTTRSGAGPVGFLP